MSHLNQIINKGSKQKIIPAIVVDVLGPRCSVRLSGVGTQMTNLLYDGPQPNVGDEVRVNYLTGKPYVQTLNIMSNSLPAKEVVPLPPSTMVERVNIS